MELPQSGQVLRVYSYSNSHYGKMDKGKIWRLIGRTGRNACLTNNSVDTRHHLLYSLIPL